jgi:hypothetical protein
VGESRFIHAEHTLMLKRFHAEAALEDGQDVRNKAPASTEPPSGSLRLREAAPGTAGAAIALEKSAKRTQPTRAVKATLQRGVAAAQSTEQADSSEDLSSPKEARHSDAFASLWCALIRPPIVVVFNQR